MNLILFSENKRQVYDKYGKEGLVNGRTGNDFEGFEGFDIGGFPGFGFTFSFRDPQDIFNEFFGSDPFANMFGFAAPNHHGHHHHGHHHGHRGQSSALNQHNGGLFGFAPFNFGFGAPFMPNDHLNGGAPGGFTTFTTFSTNLNNGASPNQTNVRKTTTSTKYVNGKRIETRKYVLIC